MRRTLVRLGQLVVLLGLLATGLFAANFTTVPRRLPQLAGLWRLDRRIEARAIGSYHTAWLAAAWPPAELVDALAVYGARQHHRRVRVRAAPWPVWMAGGERRYAALQRPSPYNRQLASLLELELMTPPCALGVLVVWLTVGGNLGRVKPGTSQGSAHWATAREMATLRRKRNTECLVLGSGPKGQELVLGPEHLYRHVAVFGPSGSGKSSGLIIPNLLRHRGEVSLVISDPKAELTNVCYGHLARDYEVWVVNFMDPERSRAYNPLAYCTSVLSAHEFANAWIENTGGKSKSEPFWDNACKTLIAAAILHLNFVLAARGGGTLAELNEFLNGPDAPAVVFPTLLESPCVEARRLAANFVGNVRKNDKLEGSVFAEIAPRFLVLADPAVMATTSRHEVDFGALGRQGRRPIALFLAPEPTKIEALQPLLACFMKQLFDALVREANNNESTPGKLARRVRFYLEEFGNLGVIPEFPGRTATVRSAGMALVLCTQDRAQIERLYERHGLSTIISNMWTRLALSGVKDEDAEYFSKEAGRTTVLQHSANRSRKRGELRANEGGQTAGETGRDLITQDEIRTMPQDTMLVLVGSLPPMKVRQLRYYNVRRLHRRASLRYGGLKISRGGPLRRSASGEADPLPAPVLEDWRALLEAQRSQEAAPSESQDVGQGLSELSPEQTQEAMDILFGDEMRLLDEVEAALLAADAGDPFAVEGWDLAADGEDTERSAGRGASDGAVPVGASTVGEADPVAALLRAAAAVPVRVSNASGGAVGWDDDEPD